jgi:hypothetical protein
VFAVTVVVPGSVLVVLENPALVTTPPFKAPDPSVASKAASVVIVPRITPPTLKLTISGKPPAAVVSSV